MSKDSLFQDLINWSVQNGSFCDPRVQIYSDQVTGLSFKAAEVIPPETQFMRCSFHATLSYLNAIEIGGPFQRHNSPPFPESFTTAFQNARPYLIGNFFLMQQYLLKEESYWWPYIRLLPQPDEPKTLAIPAWWPEEDQRCLAGTNAEPAIKKKKDIWHQDWTDGISILSKEDFNISYYSLLLYQWSATIFGTRSFRASTTLSAVLFQDALVASSFDISRISEHIRRDSFSILLPLVDIGNHNGVENVTWASDPVAGHICLANSSSIEQGDQIYNYYGNKNNSELLLGYGFIINQPNLDRVNLKITPPPNAIQLRQSQNSHAPIRRRLGSDEEFMYWVNIPSSKRTTYYRLNEVEEFAFGWFDTLSCVLANEREKRFLSKFPGYCLGSDTNFSQGPMFRNVIAVLQLTSEKLQLDVTRIQNIEEKLLPPTNSNQTLARTYRTTQKTVLVMAMMPIHFLMSMASIHGVIRLSDGKSKLGHSMASHASPLLAGIELLSLENAYDWLYRYDPKLASGILNMIADDQTEPLPLDWANLIEEKWDHTYWSIWIFTISMIFWKVDKPFPIPELAKWMRYMDTAWITEINDHKSVKIIHSENDEEVEGIIRHTCASIYELPFFAPYQTDEVDDKSESLMCFSSWLAKEELINMPYEMNGGKLAGKLLKQKILCLSYPGPSVGNVETDF